MSIPIGFRRASISLSPPSQNGPLGEHRGALCLPPAAASRTQNNPFTACLWALLLKKDRWENNDKPLLNVALTVSQLSEPVNKHRAFKRLHYFTALGIAQELLVFQWPTPHRTLLWEIWLSAHALHFINIVIHVLIFGCFFSVVHPSLFLAAQHIDKWSHSFLRHVWNTYFPVYGQRMGICFSGYVIPNPHGQVLPV